MWLKRAVVRDLNKPRDVDLPAGVVTDSLRDVVDDPDITVVAPVDRRAGACAYDHAAVAGVWERHRDSEQGVAG